VKSILFVDDEPNVLAGLRNLLRTRRTKWDMVFACGGEEAIKHIEARPFDVVITDMRMPRIDGVGVLNQAKKRQPRAVRMILSGQTELEASMRSVFLAHRFLSKPCDPQLLESVLERAARVNDLLEDPELRATAGEVTMLPAAPGVFLALSAALEKPDVAIKDVAGIVERDVALCAKILQLVNSAFFGLPRRVSSIAEAVNYLGITVIRNLALALEAFAGSDGDEERATLQRHSLLTGKIARALFRSNHARAEEAFVAGLLHDVGRLLPGRATTTGPTDKHARLGAYLLGLWGLPHAIIEAVAFHDNPRGLGHAGFELVDAVHVADYLSAQLVGGCQVEPPDLVYLAERGVTEAQLERWRLEAAVSVDSDRPGMTEAA
jgi:HD-like signal output (HDOD) protein/ActR/RegA family two-component response regulator